MCYAHWLPWAAHRLCQDQSITVQHVRDRGVCASCRETNPSLTDTLTELETLLCSVPQHDCVLVMADFNAKLPRSNGHLTGRWCIHSRGNQAGDMRGQQEKHINYLPLERDDEARKRFDASVAQHMDESPYDLDNASASLTRLTMCISTAAQETLPVNQPKPFRKREVIQHTKLLFEERHRNFHKLNELERRELTRAIATSSRDDYRQYIHKVLDDIETAESVGNVRIVSKLTSTLSHKDRRTICNP